jgi:hypothetical protein
MRTSVLVLAGATAIAVIAVAAPASAINSYNSEPAPERTEVGAFVALYERDAENQLNPDRFRVVCSGTMVDDDTFLTAAHCTDDWPEGTRLFVSLEQDVEAKLTEALDGRTPAEAAAYALAHDYVVEADPHQDPAYPGNSADAHDIGVLDFAARDRNPADIWDFTPATLPTPGQLSSLGGRALDALPWTVVGFGTQEAARGPGGQTFPGSGVRLKAPLDFGALNKTWVRLSMIEATDNGGACYGDSGGPNFVDLGASGLLLAATTITGDTPCYATNVAYRLDTASARAFLVDYVALPAG